MQNETVRAALRPRRVSPPSPLELIPTCSVRCDLKDLPLTPTGHHPPCSNCKERGLNCMCVRSSSGTFSSAMTDSIQRRVCRGQGRQASQTRPTSATSRVSNLQVLSPCDGLIFSCRAVYGKMNPEDISVHHAPPPPAVIPKLRKEFFDSPFFRKFHVQSTSTSSSSPTL